MFTPPAILRLCASLSLVLSACVTDMDSPSDDEGTLADGKADGATAAGLRRQPLPNNQDAQINAVPGLGGRYLDALPPYVFSPRRQTDQMVRQGISLLPPDLTRDVAFLHAQRVAQDPEGAALALAGKREAVLVGSLKGINGATKDDPSFTRVHDQELAALEVALALCRDRGIRVRDVLYGMGDSSPTRAGGRYVPNAFALAKRDQLEGRLAALLARYGYARPEPLTWGADELMLAAFAAQLPTRTVSLTLESPGSRSFYDSDATAEEVTLEAVGNVGLAVADDASADLHLHLFSLLPQANTAGDQTFPDATEYAAQRAADQAFAAGIARRGAALARTVIVDARLNNGALDAAALPPSPDVLGFGSWGTGGNNLGQALAMAKIVAAAEDRARTAGDAATIERVTRTRRQLAVEAIAHDVFFIGYAGGASGASVGDGRPNDLARWLRDHALPVAPGQKLTEAQLVGLYREASRHATAQLRARFPSLAGRIQFVPQPFNRRFEAISIYSEGALPQAGSVSSELVAKYPEFRPGATYRSYVVSPPRDAAVGANGRFFGP